METVWDSVLRTHNYLFKELSHPLTKDWFLIPSPYPLLGILLAYNVFCTKIGPWWMKNRQPYNLKTPILLYNIFQVIVSLYLTYEGYIHVFSGDFNFNCQGVRGDYRMARGIQVYFLVKLVELLDTVFFVLRKSDRQITFLHMYHHTLMPFFTWIGLKYFPGGQSIIIGSINSFIHIFMYVYYLMASFGPQYQKYLWWKQYLTIMQIAQFTIILAHSINSLFHICEYMTILKILTIVESSTFIYMFTKFYYLNYIMRRPKNSSKQINNMEQHQSSGSSISNEHAVSNGHDTNSDLTSDLVLNRVDKKNVAYQSTKHDQSNRHHIKEKNKDL